MTIRQEINTPATLIKSVWNTENIDSKTELTPVQIQAINVLKTSGLLFGSPLFISHVNHFMELQKSLNRKSMGEFVQALRSLKEDLIEKKDSFHLFG
jgi:hypothetical protein